MPKHRFYSESKIDKCSEQVTLLVAMLDDPNFIPGDLNQICETFDIQPSPENIAIIKDGLLSQSVS